MLPHGLRRSHRSCLNFLLLRFPIVITCLSSMCGKTDGCGFSAYIRGQMDSGLLFRIHCIIAASPYNPVNGSLQICKAYGSMKKV